MTDTPKTIAELDEMRIPITRGMHAIVNTLDYNSIKIYSWQAIPRDDKTGKYYAQATIPLGMRKNRKCIKMHRLIMGASDGDIVDHINGDPLDNRRSNLRFSSSSLNALNRKDYGDGTSKFRGVYWHKQRNKWCATIRFMNKRKHIGIFKDEYSAAIAYDNAAISIHGKYAILNFPISASPFAEKSNGHD